jgi:SAM-dependent methyltransferase
MYKQLITNGENESFRNSFVTNWLASQNIGATVLDIGAGTKPFQEVAKRAGLKYFSHDFEKYDGDTNIPGLQSPEWPIFGYDIVCDIEQLPTRSFDLAICTEVLEHVPNPVLALQSIRKTLKKDGMLLVTVPLSSRIHQAPYYFSSGLSPYWFSNHAEQVGFRIESVWVIGDFVDQFISESRAFFDFIKFKRYFAGYFIAKILIKFAPFIRKRLPAELLHSGGLGTYCILVAN